MQQARLKVIGGKHDGQAIPLTSQKFLIGRESDCHLRTNSELISRHHCVFSVDNYAVRLRDLGSTNGTFVNGERVPGQIVLNPGDRIRIGRLEFELEIPVEAPVSSEPTASTPLLEPTAGTDEGAETAYELPVEPSAADAETTVGLDSGDTAILPATPQPQHDPQQQPGYYPQFYPQYPQQGYFPPGYYPQYGAPYGPPGGYPQAPGYPPGYGPQGHPQQQPEPQSGDPRNRGGNVPSPPVRLPEPEATGAQAAPPKAPAANSSDPKAEPEKTPSERAAEIIKQRMQRRLQGS